MNATPNDKQTMKNAVQAHYPRVLKFFRTKIPYGVTIRLDAVES